jgi:hypothetical protein
MSWEPTSEPRLGPTRTDRDKEVALEELQRKIIELVRELNRVKEILTDVGIEP